MKNCYFNHETISNKSLTMLQKLEKSIKIHKINFIPEQSALLVLDMQRYFLDANSHAYIQNALPIISKIKKLADVFNEKNLPVILTRHLNTKEDAKLIDRWWKDLISEKDNLSEIIPELNFPNSIVIRKTQYDGFYQTPLEDILKEKGIVQIIITGVMTHLCCETTARSAFVRGFTVFFPVDGTATYNKNFHWATLLNLSHGFTIPVLMKELQHYLEAVKIGH